MSDLAKEIVPVTIESELKQSYLDYAMSVIVGRALPDVRDGLKPVHRRVLFAMHELGNDWNKAYKKSARVVGDVIGKYHPHGELAVYDALVRMAQPFSMRHPLVDGQGNFGSVDGDSPAAMRYTEVRMAKLTNNLLADLEKDTVDFVPNYDGTEFAPLVLPARIPNLLVNGSSGIAVGMATNIPPHNLIEIINGCIALIDNPELTIDELMHYVPGPDFPTAGIINGRDGIVEAYKTGRGRIYIRAKTHIEIDEKTSKQTLVITELPYQVNKAKLIEKIAELVKEKKLEGITELRDESDKDGMRAIIELRRGDSAEILENHLISQTQLQVVFGINMVALQDGRPRLMNLRDILLAFIKHRREVVTRRTMFDLGKARERAHILEGLEIALVNIDEVVALIKSSKNSQEAKEKLLAKYWAAGMVAAILEKAGESFTKPKDIEADVGLLKEGYKLSQAQAQAILDLRLHRLTGLEQEKIVDEYKQLLELIQSLLDILQNPSLLMKVIREELEEIQKEFGNKRRTEIQASRDDVNLEDLIEDAPTVVTLSHLGYAKIQPLDQYEAQHRGGRGKAATQVKEEDFVTQLVIANAHDTILCFSNRGKVYWLKVYELPQGTRTSLGKPIVNILPLSANERITAILPLREYTDDHYVFMATQKGTVKKVALSLFSRPRNSGIIAVDLNEGDELIGAAKTNGKDHVMLFTDAGKVIRFEEEKVRAMGRTATGVRGVKLKEDQKVISLVIAKEHGAILTATEYGYGKRTAIDEYRVTGRGGQGVISIQVSERNGAVVAAEQVFPGDEVMLMSNGGTAVRTTVEEISEVGRNAQGVRLIKLSNDEKLICMQRIAEIKVEEVIE